MESLSTERVAKPGRVYWLTGLAGAGKTTIGLALYERLKAKGRCVLLDGDILNGIVGRSGYTRENRLERARCYSRLCTLLSEQGLTVIICTIALFHEIHAMNRANIAGYREIFLNVPAEVLERRNHKGLYAKGGSPANVVGVDIAVEYPLHPHLEIINDGHLAPAECADLILHLDTEYDDAIEFEKFARDTSYWDEYYAKHSADGDLIPSRFADFAVSRLDAGAEVLELGCGNGRDSLYFLQKGLSVVAVDASTVAISNICGRAASRRGLFVCGDFVKNKVLYQKRFDAIYSRFTWHSITATQEAELLPSIVSALKPGGMLFIEARSIKDDLFGRGEKVADNAFVYNSHFRRFIDIEDLNRKIEGTGLVVDYAVEGRGFSPAAHEDPVLLRIVARKEA